MQTVRVLGGLEDATAAAAAAGEGGGEELVSCGHPGNSFTGDLLPQRIDFIFFRSQRCRAAAVAAVAPAALGGYRTISPPPWSASEWVVVRSPQRR